MRFLFVVFFIIFFEAQIKCGNETPLMTLPVDNRIFSYDLIKSIFIQANCSRFSYTEFRFPSSEYYGYHSFLYCYFVDDVGAAGVILVDRTVIVVIIYY